MNQTNDTTQDKNFYETPAAPKRAYTPAQRWLVLGVLILGVVFSWVFLAESTGVSAAMAEEGMRYAAFWLTYAVIFYAITWKVSSKKTVGWLLMGLALWLMARYLVYEEAALNFIDYLAIPLVLMLNAVECTSAVPDTRQGGYITAYLGGFFYAPFAALARFFGALCGLFGKKETNERTRAIRIGVLIGVLLALIVVPLLISADAALRVMLENAFKNLRLGPTVFRVILALVVAALFYSFIFHMAYEQKPYRADAYPKRFNSAGVAATVGILLAIYAIFAIFQFTYLTGLAGLPAELTYSGYAVRGFTELCVVVSINLVCFALCVTFTEGDRLLCGLMTGLLAATVMLLASSVARLVMYIDAYGLAINRILPFWFMLFLLALIVLCAVKLFVPRMKLLRVATGTFAAFYFALSLLNLDAIVARSVLARAEEKGRLEQTDADFLRYTLSGDAAAVLHNSPLKYEIYYDVAREDVDKLK